MGLTEIVGGIGAIADPILGFIGAELDRQHDARQDAKQRQYQGEINAANAAQQEQFAKMGIRWRMEDAMAAGVHPMAAMGFQGASAAPSYVAGDGFTSRSNYRSMGQNLARAALASRSTVEKEMHKLAIEEQKKRNRLLDLEIMEKESPKSPGFPDSSSGISHALTGQGNSAMVIEQPLRTTVTHPGRPGQDPGSIPDYAFSRRGNALYIVPSQDVKNRIEDQIIPETHWALRNYLSGKHHTVPDTKYYPLPRGQKWKWSFWKQSYRPAWIANDEWAN